MIVPVMFGREQIRGELDPRERGVERLRQRLDRQRLREAGHALDQAVATGQKADEDPLDHVALADHDLADLGEDVVQERPDSFWTCSVRAEMSGIGLPGWGTRVGRPTGIGGDAEGRGRKWMGTASRNVSIEHLDDVNTGLPGTCPSPLDHP